jgi:glycosyltransferase involved in cell wall biosynthesis
VQLLYVSLEAMNPGRAAYTHVFGLIGALEKCGWRVKMVAVKEDRSSRHDFARQLWRYSRVNVRAVLALRHADALYIRSHFAAWPLAQFARLMRVPIFHEVNGIPGDVVVTFPALHRLLPLFRWLYQSQFYRAWHLFAVTDGLAGYMRAFARHDRISVIPNGVDPTLFYPVNVPRPEAAPAGAYVVFYGDLAIWHGLDLMFAAARDSAWPAGLRLLIIGRGSAATSLHIPSDLTDRVVWIDRLLQSELPPFILHAQVGLVPITDPQGRSHTGVIPLKLVEMIACGLPVVVTDLPGQADLVREAACGIVVARDNPHAMATAIAALANSPDIAAMGQRGRALIEATYTWEAIGKKVDSKIRTAMEARQDA